MVGEPVQQCAGQTFRAEYPGPFVERQVGGHQSGAALVTLAEHLEQQFGAGFTERNKAGFVDDQQAVFSQLLLEAQQAFLVSGLHQLVNQGGGRGEAHREPLLAGCQTKAESDMGLAGAAVAERDDVLAALGIFTARQLHDQHLVERWDGLEVEAVEAFDGGEPGLPDPPLDHPAFAVDGQGCGAKR